VKRAILLVPFLFASNAVLLPYAINHDQVFPEELVGPLAAAVLVTFLLLCLVRWWLRDDAKAVVVISLFMFSVFSYASLAEIATTFTGHDRWASGSGYFLPIWILLTFLGIIGVLRAKAARSTHVSLTCIIGIGILMQPVAILARQTTREVLPHPWMLDELSTQSIRGATPDIYVIVLDAYAGVDALKGIYGYENSRFMEELKRRGFRIAANSRANYAQTHLSLASSLNMCYLDELAKQLGTDTSTRAPLLRMIENNRASGTFRSRGYRYITLSTGYLDNALKHSDLYLFGPASLSLYWNLLLDTTPASAFPRFRYNMYRDRVRYIFDELGRIPRNGQPLFVLAYITVPHHPFVFSENGDPITSGRPFTFAEDKYYYGKNAETRAEYSRLYLKQLHFVNSRIVAAVDAIIANSAQPPVILIQGDHGPSADWDDPGRVNLQERFSILNAYLLPGHNVPLFSDSISPVNMLRVVINQYFGARLPLLPDRSYYSTWSRPYAFTDVTEKVSAR
jgi:hypothetical protein